MVKWAILSLIYFIYVVLEYISSIYSRFMEPDILKFMFFCTDISDM